MDGLKQKLVRGVGWMTLQRLSVFLFNFIKLTVVTHFLSPTEFGIFGVALIALEIIFYFASSGFRQALIQKSGDVSSYLNSVWTFRIGRSILSGSLLFLLAPLAARFFKVPDAIPVIRAISIVLVIRAFVNIADVYLQKNLDFKRNFFYMIGGNAIDLIFSIAFSILLRNFWALYIGYTAGAVFRCGFSYVMFSYRPKFEFEFDKIKQLFKFSKWVFASSTIVVLLMYLDNIFVGKLVGITALGLYHVAFRFSRSGTGEINNILGQIYFPYFSAIQEEKEKSKSAYHTLLKLNALLTFYIVSGIICLSPAFTKLFLNEKWISIIPIIQILAFASVIDSVISSSNPFLKGMGKPKFVFFIQLIHVLALVAFILFFAKKGVKGIALSVVLSGIVAFISWLIIMTRLIPGFLIRFLTDVLPPLGASVFMILTLSLFWVIPGISSTDLNLFRFVLSGMCGTLSFLGIIYIYTKIVPNYGKDIPLKDMVKLFAKQGA